MQLVSYSQFRKTLYQTGCYETPPDVRDHFRRYGMCRGSLKFHALNLWAVVRGARQVRRGRFDSTAWSHMAFEYVHFVERCGSRFVVEGGEHITEHDDPVVYVGNHMSLLETFVVPAFVPEQGHISYVAKASLLRYPLFGRIIRATNPVTVGRKNAREDLKHVLADGKARLESGRSVVLFPQATRSVVFSERRFNSLGARLAERAGVPVVPLALRTDFLGKGRLLKDLGAIHPDRPVRFCFGNPVAAGSARTRQAQIVAFIRGKLQEWGMPCE